MADEEEIVQQLSRITEENSSLRRELSDAGLILEENKRLRSEIEGILRLLQDPQQDGYSLWKTFSSRIESSEESSTREVLRTERSLQLLLQGKPFGISYWNEKRECTYSSVNNETDSHFLSKELVEKDFEGLFPEASSLVALRENVFSGDGDAQRREFRVENAGSLLVVCAPFYCDNRAKGVLTISVDNTSQVAMQGRLAQMNSDMKQWERTEQNLRQTIKSADEAIEAKNTFLAVMSHEIRTPLNGVLGMAQVLATTSLDSEQKELVDAMVFSGDVLLAIISDILDLSKVESGTMKLEEREYNPRSIVKHVVQTAGAATKDHKIALEMDIAENVPTSVMGDPLRLKQVITNLVFNAVKFTKEGHVRVSLKFVEEVKSIMKRSVITRLKSFDKKEKILMEKRPLPEESSTSEQEDSDRALEVIPEDITIDYKTRKETQLSKFLVLEFAVEDTGIGIPNEAFPYLFEKFTQVHSSTTRKYGGTGLGLAICKQLVELMGGKISVSSRVGEGSTFSFTIQCRPAHKQDKQEDQQQRMKPAALEKTSSYTTAQFHRLQAGFSCTSMPHPGIESVLSCPLPVQLDKKTMTYMPGRDMPIEKFSKTALRRTSSGPARLEFSLMSEIGDAKESQEEEKLKPKLLLAEDNKVNVLVAMSMLKRLGYTADVSFNGQEALLAIQAKSYDLVLMDVCMPVLDGLEVTRRVRKFERSGSWDDGDGTSSTGSSQAECSRTRDDQQHQKDGELKHLPIVAITANALSDCEEQCVEFGMDGFLTKPVTFKKLKDVLQLFISDKSKLEKSHSDDLELQNKKKTLL